MGTDTCDRRNSAADTSAAAAAAPRRASATAAAPQQVQRTKQCVASAQIGATSGVTAAAKQTPRAALSLDQRAPLDGKGAPKAHEPDAAATHAPRSPVRSDASGFARGGGCAAGGIGGRGVGASAPSPPGAPQRRPQHSSPSAQRAHALSRGSSGGGIGAPAGGTPPSQPGGLPPMARIGTARSAPGASRPRPAAARQAKPATAPAAAPAGAAAAARAPRAVPGASVGAAKRRRQPRSGHCLWLRAGAGSARWLWARGRWRRRC